MKLVIKYVMDWMIKLSVQYILILFVLDREKVDLRFGMSVTNMKEDALNYL